MLSLNIRFSLSLLLFLSLLFNLHTFVANTNADAYAFEVQSNKSSLYARGYGRFAFGMSKGHNTMAQFQAPGADAKYRLGNEADTVLEPEFGYQYNFTSDKNFKMVFMPTSYETHGTGKDVDFDTTSQLYGMLTGLLGEDSKVWVGRRWYYRLSVNMLDYFWMNPGQGADIGGGIEGIHVGPGELRLAYFRYTDRVSGRGSKESNRGSLRADTIDMRLVDIPVNPGGTLNLWLNATNRHKARSLGYNRKEGFGVGFWHVQDAPFGVKGTNTFSVTFRNGSAVPQSPTFARPVYETHDSGYDLDSDFDLKILNSWIMEFNRDWALEWALVFRQEKRGETPEEGRGDDVHWVSTGVRPVYFLNNYLSLAWESGIDYVNNQPLDVRGFLLKTTVALQVSMKREYSNAPVIRFFYTNAWWSSEFKGHVGNQPNHAPYGTDTYGWTFGTQCEVVW